MATSQQIELAHGVATCLIQDADFVRSLALSLGMGIPDNARHLAEAAVAVRRSTRKWYDAHLPSVQAAFVRAAGGVVELGGIAGASAHHLALEIASDMVDAIEARLGTSIWNDTDVDDLAAAIAGLEQAIRSGCGTRTWSCEQVQAVLTREVILAVAALGEQTAGGEDVIKLTAAPREYLRVLLAAGDKFTPRSGEAQSPRYVHDLRKAFGDPSVIEHRDVGDRVPRAWRARVRAALKAYDEAPRSKIMPE